jgi:ferrous iron transport protein B
MPASPTNLTIALAGNPNSGKTTLFNSLTGLRQKTGNYPGVTVEKRVGKVDVRRQMSDDRRTTTVDSSLLSEVSTLSSIDLIDLPGTYSLISRSPDEKVAVDVLTGRIEGTPKPDAVVVVVDASNLQRNLYLVTQLIEMGVPMVVALNMMDVAERRGIRVNPQTLQEQLGVPVVPVVGHKGKGIDGLKRAMLKAAISPEPDWPLPEMMKREIDQLMPASIQFADENALLPRAFAERLLVGEALAIDDSTRQLVMAARQRLLTAGIEPMQADVEAHYRWIDGVSRRVTSPVVDLRIRGQNLRNRGLSPLPAAYGQDAPAALEKPVLDDAPKITLSEKIDRFLLHKAWGLLTFAVVMSGLFMSIFFLADPIMGWIETVIGAAGDGVASLLPDGVLKDLWVDGIVAGVGGVLVFIPQIAILFALLAILEDSGYLARAAFLMDRILAKVGLSGKAFVPMLSAHACAIPAIMATRTMESPRDRLRAIFVLPFLSCSARLPVYALLVGAFFGTQSAWLQGGIVLFLYALGIVAAFATSWVWSRRERTTPTSFILELPGYKFPQWSNVLRVVWTNTWAFVSKAGTIIFALSVILWALTYWPRLPEDVANSSKDAYWAKQVPTQYFDTVKDTNVILADEISRSSLRKLAESVNSQADLEALDAGAETAVASAQLRHSFAGRFGHFIEPAIKPLGFDWKMGVGLVGAFAAREVFVSTMGIVYAAGDDEDTEPLAQAMLADTNPDGTKVWTPLVAFTMLIWFVLAMQCLSTLAIVKRETNSWRWPLLQLLYMNGLAYVVCLMVYQIGRIVVG